MKTPLRVLIIDDSPDDVQLILLELRRAGFDVSWKQAETEAEMRDALEHEDWHVILSDHNMPQFTSSDALALFKSYKLDIPFIIVSGKIGEEYAVEAMKAGCYDYIMKNKLVRLGPVIQKGMEETQIKRARKVAEERLRESEQWLFTTLKSIGEAVVTTDKNGHIKFMNVIAEKMIGYIQSDAVGRPVEDILCFVNEHDGNPIENPIRKAIRQGNIFRVLNDTLMVARNGDVIPIDFNASPIRDSKQNIMGVVLVFRDITERKRAEQAIKRSLFDLTESISRTIEFRDPYTAGHQKRVAVLAKQVGEKMKLGEEKLNELYIGGLLHDIGKVGIPIDILSKPTALSDLEFRFIKEHPKTGFEIIKDAKLPWNISDIVLHHHEKLDGTGYPSGIGGDEISLETRIITVCDVLEAMSTFRPYRPAKAKEEVLGELNRGKRTKYDSIVVDIVTEFIMSGDFDPWAK